MATSILFRLARSALKHQNLPATRCLPASAATAWPANDSGQIFRTLATLISPEPSVTASRHSLEHAKEHEVPKGINRRANLNLEAKHRELDCAKLRKDLEVTDDIVNSESKLHALFLKWLSYFNKPRFVNFDVEDEKAFKQRFEIFKKTARIINQHNKSGSSFTYGLNQFAVMTHYEYARRSGEFLIRSSIRVC